MELTKLKLNSPNAIDPITTNKPTIAVVAIAAKNKFATFVISLFFKLILKYNDYFGTCQAFLKLF